MKKSQAASGTVSSVPPPHNEASLESVAAWPRGLWRPGSVSQPRWPWHQGDRLTDSKTSGKPMKILEIYRKFMKIYGKCQKKHMKHVTTPQKGRMKWFGDGVEQGNVAATSYHLMLFKATINSVPILYLAESWSQSWIFVIFVTSPGCWLTYPSEK